MTQYSHAQDHNELETKAITEQLTKPRGRRLAVCRLNNYFNGLYNGANDYDSNNVSSTRSSDSDWTNFIDLTEADCDLTITYNGWSSSTTCSTSYYTLYGSEVEIHYPSLSTTVNCQINWFVS